MAHWNMPRTRSGMNMYDIASYLQKSCRRGLNEDAGFTAAELLEKYNTVLWNRMFAISCEDCSGAFTKELVKLRFEDENAAQMNRDGIRDTSYISRAIYLLTHSNKSRDACYFACNFVIACEYNEVRKYALSDEAIGEWAAFLDGINDGQFSSAGLFGRMPEKTCAMASERILLGTRHYENNDIYRVSLVIREAIRNNDMEAAGYAEHYLKRKHREFLWKTLYAIALDLGGELCREMLGLYLADEKFNGKRSAEKKDEIFASKAIVLLCYLHQGMRDNLISQPIVRLDSFTDFHGIDYLDIIDCKLPGGQLPEWVFDCHTIRGKQAGKNDWQMNIDEQAALSPLMPGFFDEGTWQSLYEWLKDQDAAMPGKFLSKGEYEEHFAYREGRFNNPITKDIPLVTKAEFTAESILGNSPNSV